MIASSECDMHGSISNAWRLRSQDAGGEYELHGCLSPAYRLLVFGTGLRSQGADCVREFLDFADFLYHPLRGGLALLSRAPECAFFGRFFQTSSASQYSAQSS